MTSASEGSLHHPYSATLRHDPALNWLLLPLSHPLAEPQGSLPLEEEEEEEEEELQGRRTGTLNKKTV